MLNNPLVLTDPEGKEWYHDRITGNYWWVDGSLSDEYLKKHRNISKVEIGTTILATGGTGRFKGLGGHEVSLLAGGRVRDLGPPRVVEIDFQHGLGQDFFIAYVKFAGESSFYALTGTAAVAVLGRVLKAANLPGWKKVAIDFGMCQRFETPAQLNLV